MAQQVIELIVFCLVALAGIWMYSHLIGARLMKVNPDRGRRFVRRMRLTAVLILVSAATIGGLYRFHVLSLTWAGILYIPVVIAFFYAVRKLQPYLRPYEEETRDDRLRNDSSDD